MLARVASSRQPAAGNSAAREIHIKKVLSIAGVWTNSTCSFRIVVVLEAGVVGHGKRIILPQPTERLWSAALGCAHDRRPVRRKARSAPTVPASQVRESHSHGLRVRRKRARAR